MEKEKDWVLIVWTISLFAWDVLVFGTTTYLVFWKGESGWWFALAILLCMGTTYFDVMKKRYGIN